MTGMILRYPDSSSVKTHSMPVTLRRPFPYSNPLFCFCPNQFSVFPSMLFFQRMTFHSWYSAIIVYSYPSYSPFYVHLPCLAFRFSPRHFILFFAFGTHHRGCLSAFLSCNFVPPSPLSDRNPGKILAVKHKASLSLVER